MAVIPIWQIHNVIINSKLSGYISFKTGLFLFQSEFEVAYKEENILLHMTGLFQDTINDSVAAII